MKLRWLIPLAVLFSPLSHVMQGQVSARVATVVISPNEVTILHLRPEFESSIRMPEEVTSVILGSPGTFKAEHNEGEPEYVYVKPVTKEPAQLNLLVATKSGAHVTLELISDGNAASTGQPVDFLLEYRTSRSFLIGTNTASVEKSPEKIPPSSTPEGPRTSGPANPSVVELELDPVDLRGLPRIAADQTEWVPPKFLPTTGKGILFLDELTSAPQMTQAGCYQLVLDRKLGGYVLPEGWVVIAAGNPASERGVHFAMPRPLRNRFVHLELEADLDDWCKWAVKARIRPEIIAFLRLKPELLHVGDTAADANAWPTPRSWEMARMFFPGSPNAGTRHYFQGTANSRRNCSTGRSAKVRLRSLSGFSASSVSCPQSTKFSSIRRPRSSPLKPPHRSPSPPRLAEC